MDDKGPVQKIDFGPMGSLATVGLYLFSEDDCDVYSGQREVRRCSMLTRDEVLIEACSVFALVYHSKGDYSKPCDGFCPRCPSGVGHDDCYFRNSGEVLDYVRVAVLEKLKRDGFKIAIGFDDETGKEV